MIVSSAFAQSGRVYRAVSVRSDVIKIAQRVGPVREPSYLVNTHRRPAGRRDRGNLMLRWCKDWQGSKTSSRISLRDGQVKLNSIEGREAKPRLVCLRAPIRINLTHQSRRRRWKILKLDLVGCYYQGMGKAAILAPISGRSFRKKCVQFQYPVLFGICRLTTY